MQRTPAAEMLLCLEHAAWFVGTAEGKIPGIGYVNIDRPEGTNRRVCKLDGKPIQKRRLWDMAEAQ